MPLIKDKDRYKKLSARDRGRGRVTEDSNLPNKSINTTQRKRQDFAEVRKIKESKSLSNSNSVKSIHVPENTLTTVITLSPGQTLKKFLIVNNSGTTQYFDLHWSFQQKSDLTLTIVGAAAETIISEANNESTRLFKRTLGGYNSFAGANDVSPVNKQTVSFDIEDLFNNVSKNIYFYFVSTTDTHITYLIN